MSMPLDSLEAMQRCGEGGSEGEREGGRGRGREGEREGGRGRGREGGEREGGREGGGEREERKYEGAFNL